MTPESECQPFQFFGVYFHQFIGFTGVYLTPRSEREPGWQVRFAVYLLIWSGFLGVCRSASGPLTIWCRYIVESASGSRFHEEESESASGSRFHEDLIQNKKKKDLVVPFFLKKIRAGNKPRVCHWIDIFFSKNCLKKYRSASTHGASRTCHLDITGHAL